MTSSPDTRVRKRIKRNRHPEAELQKEVVAQLRAHGHEVHHSPSLGRVSKAAAVRAKDMGQEKHCADILIWTWPPTALELKAEGEKPTPEQHAWLLRRGNQGWIAGFAAGRKQAIELLDFWKLVPKDSWARVDDTEHERENKSGPERSNPRGDSRRRTIRPRRPKSSTRTS